MKNLFVIGLMSGTSMDGIDVSLLQTNGIKSKFILPGVSYPYSQKTEKLIINLNNYPIEELIKNQLLYKELSVSLTIDHAEAVSKILSKFSDIINLIGFHGQTIYHNAQKKISLQIGEPQLLSNLTEIKVVSNFRENDIQNGGEGAPLAPIYHKHLVEKHNLDFPICFLNIGGVSNISYCDKNDFLGFDTGPGNGLIDILIKKSINKPFDFQGLIAKSGTPNKNLIKLVLKDSFFEKLPPKSLDKLYFEKIFSNEEFNSLTLPDAAATLSQLTIDSVIVSLKLLPKKPKLMVMCGGGRKNWFFVERLKKLCPFKVITTEEIDIDGDFLESELISFISARSFNKLPITFPKTTGVNKPLIGGKIYKPLI